MCLVIAYRTLRGHYSLVHLAQTHAIRHDSLKHMAQVFESSTSKYQLRDIS